MEPMIDYEILGEVLIPLENRNYLSNISPTFQDLNKCNYKSFRKILFQGESLRFYIILQTNKQIPNISSLFDKIYFNLEFESTEIDKNININQNENNQAINQGQDDSDNLSFKFYSSNKNIEQNNNKNNITFNKELETINMKKFDRNSNSEVYEIIKEIIVPENYINSSLLMKVNIYLEKYSLFSENNKDTDILNLYQLGIFNNIDKYKLLKTIFKEVKVINPLNILNSKQIEPKLDITLLQTKINNYNNYDLIDNSLKFSKIFKNFKNEDEKKLNDKVKNIYIKDIRILQNETSFDEKNTDKIEFIKEILIKEKKLLNKNDFEIEIFNKSQYPYTIGSGEEFNLILKIIKNSYLNESIGSYNKLYNNNVKNKNSQLILFSKTEASTHGEVNKIIINTLGESNFRSLLNLSKTDDSTNSNSNDSSDFKKRKSVSSIKNLNKIVSPQKAQEPLLSFGNLFKKKITPITDDKITNEKISMNNKNDTPNTDNDNDIEVNAETNNNNDANQDINTNDFNLDDYFDEHFKIYYITPVILDLSSDLFYENINMCIQMKWFNEINRYLIISIVIPENIRINEYFEASIKIKNISFNPMNLIIQIKDNENKDTPMANISKNIENVPSILSQTKIEHFGLIDCGDEKIFSLKFLPLIHGYCYLPNLTLIDIYSERKFYIVQSNKIYVEQENKPN